MQNRKINSSGITLIELAIVLLVLALISGGIVAGRSLLRASEVQAMVSESARYTQAINTFRDKFKALPGDFAMATTVWGASHATHATCITKTDPADSIVTCNGDGNGRITNQDSIASTYYEQFRAWQHLANAGLIEGNYTGIAESSLNANYGYKVGKNIPTSKISAAGWKLLNISVADIAITGVTDIPYTSNSDMQPNLVLWLGGAYFEASNRMTGVISPIEAFDIDQKIDDGKPETGKLISETTTGITNKCYQASAYSVTDATYKDTLACSMVFKTGL